MRKSMVFLMTGSVLLIMSSLAFSSNCDKAVEIYNEGTVSEKDLIQREQLFKKALSLGCKNREILAKIHNNLADVYEKQKNIDLAIKEYQEALKLDPKLATSYFSLGDIYFKKGVFEYAIENYEEGLSLKDDKLALVNVTEARKKIPLYRSKNDIVASLSVKRCIRQVPSVNLYFGFDKAMLTAKSERQLKSLLNALRDNELNAFRFRLTGHTCSIGTAEYNQQLSERRAEAVRIWLDEHNYSSSYLEATGLGERKPIEDNNTEEGRILNRRVEIRTVGIVVSGERKIDNREMKLFQEGQKLYDQKDYKSAAIRFEKVLRLFKEGSNKEGIRAALGTLAIVHRELGNDQKVSSYLEEYQKIDKDSN